MSTETERRLAPSRLASIRLVKAELFKLRTTSMWWLFAGAALISTVVLLVVNMVNAHSLLKPYSQYLVTASHGHADSIPKDFAAHIRSEWLAGHDVTTQAATLYTSSELIGLLLAGLLGIVLVTSEYQQQTATSTFLVTPRRTAVFVSKLLTAVVVAAGAWLVSTVISVVAGAVFLNGQGFSTGLGDGGVVRAMLLNLAAYVVWACLGTGFGAVVRNQLAATVSATVVYLAGAGAGAALFDLIYTYLIPHTWILTAQVVVPSVASAVMISPTRTFDQSPAQWTGAVVLVAYGIAFAVWGARLIRRRDIA